MQKLDIALVVAGMPFNASTLETKSLGGSESAGLYMALALAKLGHSVYLFCNTDKPETAKGVRFLPLQSFHTFAASTPHDVTIIQRAPELFGRPINSRLTILWCHDQPVGRRVLTVRGALWNVDGVMVLSEFMRKAYREVYDIAERTLLVTRNGVDLEAVASAPQEPREPCSMLYAARPERGLENLLDMMPAILEKEPRAKLYCATYDNPVAELAPYYEKLKAKMDALGDAVVPLAPLTKVQLYRLMKGMTVYAYPTPSAEMAGFAEVSCIAAMEAQACGLPIVTSDRGALPETIWPGAGHLISGDPWTPEYRAAFVEKVVSLFHNEGEWRAMSELAARQAQKLDWSDVAEEWSTLFRMMIETNNDTSTPRGAVRLARHLWRQSDIMALKVLKDQVSDKVLRTDPGDADWHDAIALMAKLYEPFAFIESPEATREQYEKIGGTHDERVFEHIPAEPRFQVMTKWLKRTPQVKTVLDYGCGMGAYAFHMHKETGVQVTALDIDHHSLAIGMKKRDEAGISADDLRFMLETRLSDVEPKDCAVIQEVLEHVAEPWKLAEKVEARVKPGGYVYITVPYGPWEYESYYTYPHRCHVWHFDRHDLREMFGSKPECSVFSVSYGESSMLGDPLGWWVVIYKADHKSIPAVDIGRKLWLQRPRQTVSLNIMAGGEHAEETLHWCLKPLKYLADEVVIADCGLTPEAVRIIGQHRDPFTPLKIIKAPSPVEAGFETPRNLILERSTSDWVLMIDTDEKLIDPQNVNKYLRNNEYSAYQIRQHHFACDTTVKPDMPCRLFRTTKGIRYYGMIHEHPETELNKGPGPSVVLSDAHIAHVGYLIESTRRGRFQRNLPMLQADIEKYPKRVLQKHFIMRDTMLLVNYQLQRNGGVITDQMRVQAKEVQELYREHFLGKVLMSSLDPLEYYSAACAVLGEGFEAEIAIGADKVAVEPDNVVPLKARFANMDDYLTFVNHRAKRVAAPLVSENY
jgi:glycosyltransferase involved in cell wall biosynthesis/SAM-dependent methyltransferase